MEIEKEISGYFFRSDLTEMVSESFAKSYNMDLSGWVQPYGYYDERHGSVFCNDNFFPDGTYIALGKVSYPGVERRSWYHIGQFNVARSMGLELRWANKFETYPNLPETLKKSLSPTFPLIQVGEVADYGAAVALVKELNSRPLTARTIKDRIKKAEPDSLEHKIYRLRLAFQKDIDKEK